MSEARTQQEILLSVGQRPDCRVWRMNTAAVEFGGVTRKDLIALLDLVSMGCTLQSVEHTIRGWLKRKTQLVRAGFKGQADIGGVLVVTGPTGLRLGIRLEIEVKSAKGRMRPEQKAYRRIIEENGGIYILARSAQEANELIDTAKRTIETELAEAP